MELPAVGSHLLVVEYHTSGTAWVQVHGSGGDDGLLLVEFVAPGRTRSLRQRRWPQQPQPQQPQPQQPQQPQPQLQPQQQQPQQQWEPQASQLQAVQQAQPQQPQQLQQQAQPQQPQLRDVQQAQQPQLGDEEWGNLWRRPPSQTEDWTQQQQQPQINRPGVDGWLYTLRLMQEQQQQQQPQQQQQGPGELVLTPTGDEVEGDEYNPWDQLWVDPVDNSADPEILETHSASG